MIYYTPKRMVLDIQKSEKHEGIITTIYIPIKDFKKRK